MIFSSWTKSDPHEEAEERIRIANEVLLGRLSDLMTRAGANTGAVRVFDPGNAGIGTLSNTIAVLMACVSALSDRVKQLENK